MRANNNRRTLALVAISLFAALGAARLAAYDLIEPVSFWPVGDVNWKENLVGNGTNIPIPSGGSPLQDGSTSWGEALQKAFDDLNAVIPDSVLTLSLTQNSGIAAGNQDTVNNVAFAPTVYGNAWGGSTVGISLSLWTGQRKIENDVLFNATKTWNSYTGAQQNGITDLRRIALHEFGHSLGLDHPDQAGQVVSAIMNSVSSDIYQLQQDDIDGLLFLYGAVMPVTITKHPTDYSTPVGGTWMFSVAATGSELITYDWEQSTDNGGNWTDIGFPPTTTSGSFSSLGMGQNGMQIRVNVMNPAGTVTSNVATLTVTAGPIAPAITTHPSDASVDVGLGTSFTVAASGSATPAIQWQVSSNSGGTWSNINNGFVLPSGPTYSGATSTTLSITGAVAGINGYQYRAVATNTAGNATSNAATLTVNGAPVTPPSITTHPANATVIEGEQASFTVVATGTAPLTYQWRKNGLNITGATSATYTLNATNALDAGTYSVVVTNSGGSATSNNATLTVNVPPSITTHPSPQTVTAGAAVSFTVAATGTAPLSYQWRKGGVNIGGATSATYNIAATVAGDAGSYTCVVTNVAGSATSNVATLTVNVPPSITSHPASKTAVIGSDVTFSVTATGTAPLSYQWKRGTTNVGTDSPTLTVTDVQPGAGATYTVVVTNVAGSATSNPATLTLDTTPRLINVSCLASAGSGDSTLVVGFYISGTGNKTLLIRGVGARLAQDPFNLPNTVADPQLRVYKGSTLIDTNDDWDSALAPDFSRVGAFALADGSKDAALKIALEAPGLYSVHLVNTGATADAIIEIYDFSRDSASRLTNVSSRLNMKAGEIVTLGTALIASPTPVLARAIGPGLAPYIIEPPSILLPDPFLRVFVSGVEVAANDDWESALQAYFGGAGAFPVATDSADAMVRVTPTPGSLTIQATGKGGTGVALIEIYESPEP